MCLSELSKTCLLWTDQSDMCLLKLSETWIKTTWRLSFEEHKSRRLQEQPEIADLLKLIEIPTGCPSLNSEEYRWDAAPDSARARCRLCGCLADLTSDLDSWNSGLFSPSSPVCVILLLIVSECYRYWLIVIDWDWACTNKSWVNSMRGEPPSKKSWNLFVKIVYLFWHV